MANGDIPVVGSAPDPNNLTEFTIRYETDGVSDARNHMLVRTQGRPLHIRVNNGAGKIFDEDLETPGWTLRITPR